MRTKVREEVAPEGLGYTIRQLGAGDAGQIRQLFISINRELAPEHMAEVFEAYIAQALTTEIDRLADYYAGQAGPTFWVYEINGSIVGTYGLERVGEHAWELRRMYVASAFRRQGIGRLLLADAIRNARALGARELQLSTSELQPAAIELYDNAGFELEKVEKAEAASHKTVGAGITRYYYRHPL